MKHNEAFEKAYWKTFEEFFGKQNSTVVKAMLLARNDTADTGTRRSTGLLRLRQSMGWLAEAIERKALPPPTPVETDSSWRGENRSLLEREPSDDLVVRLLRLDSVFRSSEKES